MKKPFSLSRVLLASAVMLGWRAQAEPLGISRDQLAQANIPSDVISKLLDAQIILVGKDNMLCFDDGNVAAKSGGDQELLSYVELLQQMTTGSSAVERCTPGVMQMGSQGIGAAK